MESIHALINYSYVSKHNVILEDYYMRFLNISNSCFRDDGIIDKFPYYLVTCKSTSFLGRQEVERSEGLLSLPGCGRALCVVCRVSFTRPSAVDSQIINLCFFVTIYNRA